MSKIVKCDRETGWKRYQLTLAELTELDREIRRIQPKRNQPRDVALNNNLQRRRRHIICKLNQLRIRYWIALYKGSHDRC